MRVWFGLLVVGAMLTAASGCGLTEDDLQYCCECFVANSAQAEDEVGAACLADGDTALTCTQDLMAGQSVAVLRYCYDSFCQAECVGVVDFPEQ
jgi:hypothetical protein